jgi:hypothetical protein
MPDAKKEQSMNTQDIVESWMRHVGLADEALIAHDHRCSFKADSNLEMSIEWPPASDDLFLVVKLLPAMSGELRRMRLEEAMRLNAFSLTTRGAVIGWDEAHDQLILSYRMDREWVDAVRLGRAVVNLCEVAQEVTRSLSLVQDEAPARAVQPQGADAFQQFRA